MTNIFNIAPMTTHIATTTMSYMMGSPANIF